MTPIYKEAKFPVDYREVEVRQIIDAVYKLRSIAITGLAGMGKSNVVRFIVSHPQVLPRYLGEKANDYAFVHVDCASLADTDEDELLSEIVTQLRASGISAGAVHSPQISRRIRHRLRDKIRSLESSLNLVLVLDYFDEPSANLGKAFFNYLRHLRDIRPGANLSFVFATRRPMGYLYEFQELLDDPCAIGPLSHKDALDSIQRDEARIGCTFDEAQREKLIACTGGHPGFLKNASELLGSVRVKAELPVEDFAKQLLGYFKIRGLCTELWSDLTSTEQSTMLSAAGGGTLPKTADGECLAYLEHSGLLAAKKDRPGHLDVAVFCPLFETFLSENQSAISEIRVTAVPPRQARVETALGEERIMLSARVFDLLLVFTGAHQQRASKEEIIYDIYGPHAGEECYGALSGLVRRLRGKLNPCIQRMLNKPDYDCVQTVRGYGYRFKPECTYQPIPEV